jgi:hypothetical protein
MQQLLKAFAEGRSLSVGQAHSSVAAHAAACLLEASAMVAGTQELLDELCTNGVLALEVTNRKCFLSIPMSFFCVGFCEDSLVLLLWC